MISARSSPSNKLHNKKHPLAFTEVIHDARKRGVMKLRQQTRFMLKLFSQARVARKRLLDRDGRIQPQIDRFIDCAHPAFAELPHDAITVLQFGSRNEL